jgi:hypothetical protein
METINPFASDEFKKHIMESEGISPSSSPDDMEILEPEDLGDENKEFKDIIKNTPKIPKGVKNVILDASALSKNEKEAKATELNLALSDVLSRYNKEYGTSLSVDFSSMSRTMVAVSDPKSRRILELYLSEIFQSIRPVLILQMISKLTLAIDYILDPERMFGGELQLTDIWISIEKIMQYIQQLEAMKDEILIKGADLELKKLGDQDRSQEIGDLDQNEVVRDFMKMFKKDNGLSE